MQVVHGFDVDACSLLYDGQRVWATERALYAWHSGGWGEERACITENAEENLLIFQIPKSVTVGSPILPPCKPFSCLPT